MTGSDGRGVSTVVATVLMAAIVVIIASSIGVTVFDVGSALEEPQEPRAFGDAEVTLGPEHREWSGWNSRVGDPPRGDIDVISLRYIAGSTFEGDDIGSVLIRWEGSEGEGGQVRFLNPNLFDEDSEQRFHSQDVGEFCTGDLGVGETLTVRMVHNRYQSSGDTGTSRPPFRYVSRMRTIFPAATMSRSSASITGTRSNTPATVRWSRVTRSRYCSSAS